jgi:flagellar basal-body rod protein FlgC
MTAIFNIALSALNAQTKRLAVSADNVANINSVGVRPGATPQAGEFVPQKVELSSIAGGGVQAKAVPVDPPGYLVPEPGAPDAGPDGLVARPNVSLEQELVTQIEALRTFQANVKVIQAEDRRLGDLLDVVS